MKHLDYEIILPRKKSGEELEIAKWCFSQWGEEWDLFENREGVWTYFWAGPGVRPSSFRWCFNTQEQANWFALRWV